MSQKNDERSMAGKEREFYEVFLVNGDYIGTKRTVKVQPTEREVLEIAQKANEPRKPEYQTWGVKLVRVRYEVVGEWTDIREVESSEQAERQEPLVR